MRNNESEMPVETFPQEPNIQELAANMSDEEMKALVIRTYQMTRFVYGFCQDLAGMLNQMASNPMLAAMMPKDVVPGQAFRK